MTEAKRGIPLHFKILIGLLIGLVAGLGARWMLDQERLTKPQLDSFIDNWTKPIGNVFLYMIFMVVVPLLLSALILGVAELGYAKKVGRIGLRSLLMTVILSGIAVTLGLIAVNVVKPGVMAPEKQQEIIALYADKSKGDTQLEAARKTPDDPPMLGFIPRNPIKEMNRALEGGLLPFMFFALVFGVALSSVEPEKSLALRAMLEGVFAASLKVIEFAMRLAPIGVAALVFGAVAGLGGDVLRALSAYFVLVLVVLAFHQFVVYSFVLAVVARRNPLTFFRQIKTVMLTAFSTSSSNATLPTALKAAEEEVGLPRNISSFVLTVGATANQNGTALFEGITILFLAQLFGVDLDMTRQLTVMGLAIVAGIGTAGVPGGAWPMIATVLVLIGVPAEAVGIVIGIDRLLDMSRTVLNVTGDITIAACVTAMEERSEARELAASAA